MKTEPRYYTDRHTLEISKVAVDPDDADNERTGLAFPEDCLFKDLPSAKAALKEHVRAKIEANRASIEKIEEENSMLIEKVMTL